MPLASEVIDTLRKPFGTLLVDKDITKQKIKSFLKNAKTVVSVGDATTDRLVSFGILPDLSVIDGKERRLRRGTITRTSYYLSSSFRQRYYKIRELRCLNPPGSISREAISVLQDALRVSEPVTVIVEGEEDMLALPIFTLVPNNSVVMYGQPLEGIVLVKINAKIRKKAKDLMDRIGID
jgi:GTP-dependent dephospho-CoA kinase